MNVVSVVMLVIVTGLLIWLVIDTVIFCVKKAKIKKQEKLNKDSQDTSN